MAKRRRKSTQSKGGGKRKRPNEGHPEPSLNVQTQQTSEPLENADTSVELNSVNLVTPPGDQLFTFPYTTLPNPQGPNQFYLENKNSTSSEDSLETANNSSVVEVSSGDAFKQANDDTTADILSTAANSSTYDIVPGDNELQNAEGIAPTTVIDIIDVDKLPDRPDSPIGDDVVEIEPPETTNSSNIGSTRRRFVDLTDPEEATTEALLKEATTKSGDNESNNSDDLPNFLKLNSRVSKEEPSAPVSNISCPICMDDTVQISNSNRKLMSTMCGHIFCDACVKKTVETLGRCPTCRKRVRKKQLRQIFL